MSLITKEAPVLDPVKDVAALQPVLTQLFAKLDEFKDLFARLFDGYQVTISISKKENT